MKLKVRELLEGPGPSEAIVGFRNADGNEEEVVIDKASLTADTIPVSGSLSARGNARLVELPRETVRGQWRVWVDSSALSE
jgi:hypothetical protein